MTRWLDGLMMGWLGGLVLAAVVAVYAYRRFITLQRRTRRVERLAELGTLTSGLAHEIKNPLSTVQLNLQLLREDLGADHADTRVLNRLDIVQRETNRLRTILDDFLRYAGKLELARRPVELNKLLDELVDFFLPQAQQQRVKLRFKHSDAPVVASIDPGLIQQAILNLLLNAIQAMSDGGSGGGAGGAARAGGDAELILTLGQADGQAIIDVIDTGNGIAPDVLQKVFDAYYSTRSGGAGLGLAMTRRIIQEHGGELTVKSEVGKGSDFTVRLPLQPAGGAAAPVRIG